MHEIFTFFEPVDQAVKQEDFGIWGRRNNRVGYDVLVSTDLDVDYLIQKVVDDMDYFSRLTGVDFYRVNGLSESQMTIAISSKYEYIKDIDFVKFVNERDKKNAKAYEEHLSGLDDTGIVFYKRNYNWYYIKI